MLVDFSIFPVGKKDSLSGAVAQAFEVIEQSGLPHEFHSMGTNIEGEWDAVMAVIKACRDRLLERADRVSISIRIDDREAAEEPMAHKVASARAKMTPTLG